MKKHYLIISLAMALALGIQNIAIAQNNDMDNKVIEEINVESTDTEISNTPAPYRPDVIVEKPITPLGDTLHYPCSVTGVDSGSYLNVRSKPSTSGTIIGSFAAGATIFCEYLGDHTGGLPDWWYATGTDKSSGKRISGYVSSRYVTCSPTRKR